MQKTNSVSGSTQVLNLIDTIEKPYVAIVVNTIITAVTASECHIYLYNPQGSCCHDMIFSLQANETIFIDSKLFLPQGYSLKVKSNNSDTTFTAMYDISINS